MFLFLAGIRLLHLRIFVVEGSFSLLFFFFLSVGVNARAATNV